MLYGSIISETKPIIALARNKDGTIKLSGRGTSELVRRGLNLGAALKEIGTVIAGVEGGGHKVAAGAKIPSEKLEEFLAMLEKKLEKPIPAKQLLKSVLFFTNSFCPTIFFCKAKNRLKTLKY